MGFALKKLLNNNFGVLTTFGRSTAVIGIHPSLVDRSAETLLAQAKEDGNI